MVDVIVGPARGSTWQLLLYWGEAVFEVLIEDFGKQQMSTERVPLCTDSSLEAKQRSRY
jgi:hypothetical protein